ncbi:HipA domain-containing protein [Micrococcus terreus]|uniref:HipA domain-containing protein n=1 Tax=Micrococcus terreus TaxID=574650 RepID=UPI00301B0FD9
MTERLDLNNWLWAFEEPAGDSDKQWLVDPAGTAWLFKPLKQERSPDEAASEFVASSIAQVLRIPAAYVRLGQLRGKDGCVSRNVIEERHHGLVEGATYISAVHENFDPKSRHSIGHNIPNILAVLKDLDPPTGAASGLTAIEAFAEFLMLDALIGNTDRHSKNWGVETALSGPDRLAATFDHATSLGITLRGPKRDRILSDPDRIDDFVRGACAHRFENGRSTTLVDFAGHFMLEHGSRIRDSWTSRMIELHPSTLEEIVTSANMTSPGANLARHVLRINRERIIQWLTSR